MVTALRTGYKVTKVIALRVALPLVTSGWENRVASSWSPGPFGFGFWPLASSCLGSGDGSTIFLCPSPSTNLPPAPDAPIPPNEPKTDFHIGDEFGTAKRNLPPARIVAISIALVAIIVGFIAFRERARPQGAGAIRLVSAAEVPGQTPPLTLAAVTFTLRNAGDKPLWVRSLKAQLVAGDGQTYEDAAASAIDVDRYYQMFPALKDSSEPPLSPETKLMPGDDKSGTIVVSFPLAKQAFDQRKALSVVIQPYDQPLAIVLK